jgi:hypothetical protein
MLRRLWLVVASFIAGVTIALTTTSVWAWTQQTVTPNGNYDFNYGPLDDKNKSDESTNKSDPNANSPGFHFSFGQGQSGELHSFGGGNNARIPDPYFHTFGN